MIHYKYTPPLNDVDNKAIQKKTKPKIKQQQQQNCATLNPPKRNITTTKTQYAIK